MAAASFHKTIAVAAVAAAPTRTNAAFASAVANRASRPSTT